MCSHYARAVRGDLRDDSEQQANKEAITWIRQLRHLDAISEECRLRRVRAALKEVVDAMGGELAEMQAQLQDNNLESNLHQWASVRQITAENRSMSRLLLDNYLDTPLGRLVKMFNVRLAEQAAFEDALQTANFGVVGGVMPGGFDEALSSNSSQDGASRRWTGSVADTDDDQETLIDMDTSACDTTDMSASSANDDDEMSRLSTVALNGSVIIKKEATGSVATSAGAATAVEKDLRGSREEVPDNADQNVRDAAVQDVPRASPSDKNDSCGDTAPSVLAADSCTSNEPSPLKPTQPKKVVCTADQTPRPRRDQSRPDPPSKSKKRIENSTSNKKHAERTGSSSQIQTANSGGCFSSEGLCTFVALGAIILGYTIHLLATNHPEMVKTALEYLARNDIF